MTVSNNRIPALATDRSIFAFDVPAGAEEIEATARLLFRGVFWDMAEEKEWDIPDIVMEEEAPDLPAGVW